MTRLPGCNTLIGTNCGRGNNTGWLIRTICTRRIYICCQIVPKSASWRIDHSWIKLFVHAGRRWAYWYFSIWNLCFPAFWNRMNIWTACIQFPYFWPVSRTFLGYLISMLSLSRMTNTLFHAPITKPILYWSRPRDAEVSSQPKVIIGEC